MPELPEIEILRQSVEPLVVGNTFREVLFYRDNLRDDIPKEDVRRILLNQKITKVSRRSKYFFIETASGCVGFHLGMSGQFTFETSANPSKPHTHAVFQLMDGNAFHFIDPRRFGRIFTLPLAKANQEKSHKFLDHLGVEPLETEDLGEYLFESSRTRKTSIKIFLMDASVVVGIGNIYANEILFKSRISPFQPANKLSLREFKKISLNILKILRQAISNGGSSIKDYVHIGGGNGEFQQNFKVYGRSQQYCLRCKNHTIKSLRQGGRSTFFCKNCQNVLSTAI